MKIKKGLAILLACIMVGAAIVLGASGRPVSRDASLYVTDHADAFSPQARQELISRQTDRSVRLSVAAVRSTGKLSTADYAEALWNNWQLSSSDLLLVLVTGSKLDYFFGYDTGSYAGQLLNDSYDWLLQTALEPDFAAGDYASAVLTFDTALQQQLAAVKQSSDAAGDELFYGDEIYGAVPAVRSIGTGFGLTVLVCIVIFVLVLRSVSRIGRRRTPRVYRSRPMAPPPPGPRPGMYRPPMGGPSRPRTGRPPMSRPTMSRPPMSRPSAPRPSRPSGGSRGGFGGGGRSSGGFGGGGRSGGSRGGGFGGGGRR